MVQPHQKIQLSAKLSEEQLAAICEAADVIACQCPSYLVRLLQEVREFHRYTNECIQTFPDDANIHDWLAGRAAQLELFLSQVIFELLQREQLLDGDNNLCLAQLNERARSLALQQMSLQSATPGNLNNTNADLLPVMPQAGDAAPTKS
jgi:hypothetical protein